MTMWFFDEAGENFEYQTFRRKDQPLELEYLKIRIDLRAAEVALRDHPGDPELEARVADLQRRLADLEQQAPWLTFQYPVEYLLWGPPHG
jgi:hypothetical protein